MNGGTTVGSFTLSIDLELDIDHQTEARRDRLDEIRSELISLLDNTGIPATWAVADPAVSAATDPILASPLRHEIAVLADRTWFGLGSGRLRLRRELSRRFDRARRLGLSVTTLVQRNVDEPGNLEMLAEHGISVLRDPPVELGGRKVDGSSEQGPVRRISNVWSIPVNESWWLPRNWRCKRAIVRAAKQGEPVHLAIDTSQLTCAGPREMVVVAELLGWLATARDQGLLAPRTLGSFGDAVAEGSLATPRAALRPAA